MLVKAIVLALTGTAVAMSPSRSIISKRGLMTCVETFGAGWVNCGGQSSNYCFNPSVGQTCCATDAGYCSAGSYCAPVAGFCCAEGQTLATCAKNAGFTIPSGYGTTGYGNSTTGIWNTTTSSSSDDIVIQTVTALVVPVADTAVLLDSTSDVAAAATSEPAATPPILTGSTAGSSLVQTLTGTTVAAPTLTSPASTAATAASSSTAKPTPVVQVSLAQKEQWTLLLMSVAMGAVGLFMALC